MVKTGLCLPYSRGVYSIENETLKCLVFDVHVYCDITLTLVLDAS